MRKPAVARLGFVWPAAILALSQLMLLPIRASSATSSPDLSIALPHHATVGAGIVNTTADGQTVAPEIGPGKTKRAYVEVANHRDGALDVLISGPGSSGSFTETYRDSSEADVTEAVVAGTYEMHLGPKGRGFLTMSIRTATDADTGEEAFLAVTGSDAGDSSLRDVVAASATVPPLRLWSTGYAGRWRCGITFPHRYLRAGFHTHVAFTLTNLTDKPRWYPPAFGYLVFRDQNGDKIANSKNPYEDFLFPARKIKPHRTVKLGVYDTVIRWSGPLETSAVCAGVRVKPVEYTFPVTSPGAPASDQAAIDTAVAIDGSPFEACPPKPDGKATTGSFETPDGRKLPPVTLRCTAELQREVGFDVVSLNLISPSDGPDYTIDEHRNIDDQFPPGSKSLDASRWSFVVTSKAAHPYFSAAFSRGVGDGPARTYDLDRGHWTSYALGCGWEGDSIDVRGRNFSLDWLSACSNEGSGPERRFRHIRR